MSVRVVVTFLSGVSVQVALNDPPTDGYPPTWARFTVRGEGFHEDASCSLVKTTEDEWTYEEVPDMRLCAERRFQRARSRVLTRMQDARCWVYPDPCGNDDCGREEQLVDALVSAAHDCAAPPHHQQDRTSSLAESPFRRLLTCIDRYGREVSDGGWHSSVDDEALVQAIFDLVAFARRPGQRPISLERVAEEAFDRGRSLECWYKVGNGSGVPKPLEFDEWWAEKTKKEEP